MTTFAFNGNSAGTSSITTIHANTTLPSTNLSGACADASFVANDNQGGGDGTDFFELSDATAGVDLELSDTITAIAAGGPGSDEIQSFEALMLSAFADLIDAKALAKVLCGTRRSAEAC